MIASICWYSSLHSQHFIWAQFIRPAVRFTYAFRTSQIVRQQKQWEIAHTHAKNWVCGCRCMGPIHIHSYNHSQRHHSMVNILTVGKWFISVGAQWNRKTDKFCNQFDYYHLHWCEQLPPNGHAATDQKFNFPWNNRHQSIRTRSSTFNTGPGRKKNARNIEREAKRIRQNGVKDSG